MTVDDVGKPKVGCGIVGGINSRRLRMIAKCSNKKCRRKGGPAQSDFEEIQDNCLEKLMERGDILLYGGGNKGECANIFNQVANAIAIMSFLPGGIKIFGRMWISCAK